jgi:hypothetical protein
MKQRKITFVFNVGYLKCSLQLKNYFWLTTLDRYVDTADTELDEILEPYIVRVWF